MSHKLPYPALTTTRDFHSPITALRGTHLNFPQHKATMHHVCRCTTCNIQIYQAFYINVICTYAEACTSTTQLLNTTPLPPNSNFMTMITPYNIRPLYLGTYNSSLTVNYFWWHSFSLALISFFGVFLSRLFHIENKGQDEQDGSNKS